MKEQERSKEKERVEDAISFRRKRKLRFPKRRGFQDEREPKSPTCAKTYCTVCENAVPLHRLLEMAMRTPFLRNSSPKIAGRPFRNCGTVAPQNRPPPSGLSRGTQGPGKNLTLTRAPKRSSPSGELEGGQRHYDSD